MLLSFKVELETKIEELGGEQNEHRTSIDDQNKGFYELKKKKDKLQVGMILILPLCGTHVKSLKETDLLIFHQGSWRFVSILS